MTVVLRTQTDCEWPRDICQSETRDVMSSHITQPLPQLCQRHSKETELRIPHYSFLNISLSLSLSLKHVEKPESSDRLTRRAAFYTTLKEWLTVCLSVQHNSLSSNDHHVQTLHDGEVHESAWHLKTALSSVYVRGVHPFRFLCFMPLRHVPRVGHTTSNRETHLVFWGDEKRYAGSLGCKLQSTPVIHSVRTHMAVGSMHETRWTVARVSQACMMWGVGVALLDVSSSQDTHRIAATCACS